MSAATDHETGLGGVPRGCGKARVDGGVYVAVPLGNSGRPLADFLMDPPKPFPADVRDALGIRPVGISTITGADGVTHLVDWVGSQHYPNVADIIEEVRRHGLSRRISTAFDFSLITEQSRIILLHARGYIHNHAQFAEQVGLRDHGRDVECPQGKPAHDQRQPPVTEMCAGLWWHDVDPATTFGPTETGGQCHREMPWGGYNASVRPAVAPQYEVAAIAVFPVNRLEVVNAPGNPKSLAAASKAGVRVLETDN